MKIPSLTAPGAQETGWAGPGHVLRGGELHGRFLKGADSGPSTSPTDTAAVTDTVCDVECSCDWLQIFSISLTFEKLVESILRSFP
jgi:hypothetical protein